MAIALDASATGSGNTLAHTCTGANLILIASFQVEDSTGVTACTYNGVAMTKLSALQFDSGLRSISTYYLLNPSTGANNIVATASGTFKACVSVSYTGVGGIDNTGNNAQNQSGSDTGARSLTTVADNSRVIMGVNEQGGTQSAGTGATQRAYSTSTGTIGLYDNGSNKTPAGSVSMTVNFDLSRGYAYQIFSIRPLVVYSQSFSDSITLSEKLYVGNILRETITMITVMVQTLSDSIGMTDVLQTSKIGFKNLVKHISSFFNQDKS